MAITKKAKKESDDSITNATERVIEDLINKGGSSTKANQETLVNHSDDDVLKPFMMRLYQSHHNEIEQIINAIPKRKRPSKHAYLMQCIEEIIQRDLKKLK